jgi:hypothetical protein
VDPSGPDAARKQLEIGLSKVEESNAGPVRWGAPYAVTCAPPNARSLNVTARTDPETTTHATVTVRVDGDTLGRLELTDGAWRSWSHQLGQRESSSPVCIELIAQPAVPGEPLSRLLYRASFWIQ